MDLGEARRRPAQRLPPKLKAQIGRWWAEEEPAPRPSSPTATEQGKDDANTCLFPSIDERVIGVGYEARREKAQFRRRRGKWLQGRRATDGRGRWPRAFDCVRGHRSRGVVRRLRWPGGHIGTGATREPLACLR